MRGRFALRHCSTVRGFFTMANPKPEIISRAMFAARRGVRPKTVDRWIALGRISGKALTRDGKIAVAEAERQLAITHDVVRSVGKLSRAAGGNSQVAVREEILKVELKRRRLQLGLLRGTLCSAADVELQRGRGIAALISALDNWVAGDLPTALNLDATGRMALRAEWRRFRTREADAAEARAASLPEFVGWIGDDEAGD
jgi:hypothetical protein